VAKQKLMYGMVQLPKAYLFNEVKNSAVSQDSLFQINAERREMIYFSIFK
jgi:hypothetical protein